MRVGAAAGRMRPPEAARAAEAALVDSASPIGLASTAEAAEVSSIDCCLLSSSWCCCCCILLASSVSLASSIAACSGVKGCVRCEKGLMREGPRSRAHCSRDCCVAEATHAAVEACDLTRAGRAELPGRIKGEAEPAALREGGRDVIRGDRVLVCQHSRQPSQR